MKTEKRGQDIVFLLLAIAVAGLGLFLMKPEITGLFVADTTLEYEQPLNLVINQSRNITITLENTPDLFILTSLKLSGSVIGNGTAFVNVNYNNQTYTIIDILTTNYTNFNRDCIGTCELLPSFNKTTYEFSVLINGTILFLDSLYYSLWNLTTEPDKEKLQLTENVELEVIEELEEKNETRVIVLFKEPKEKEWKAKKKKIKKTQSIILSTLEEDEFKLKHKYSTISGFAGKITKKGLKKLQQDQNVKKIYLDKQYNITLDESVPLINATDVHSMQVHGINIRGAGQTVCIIDTGIDYNHTALGGGWGNKVISGYDFVYGDSDPFDDHGHGTHVAGIVASTDSTYKGVAPDAKLVAIKACSYEGKCQESDFVAGIDWCTDNAAQYNISVITLSIGGGAFNNPADCDVLLAAQSISTARSQGIIVTAASGNDKFSNAINYPACASNATSVGATTKSDSIAAYSNTDEILDILAPGSLIKSTVPTGSCELCDSSSFRTLSGTSMSTPHAAGAAALLYQYEKLVNNRTATPEEIEELLKREGVLITDSDNGLSFPRIDILASINSILKINETDNSIADTENNAKIKFSTETNLTKASEAFEFDYNFVSLDSAQYPQFNKSANLTFYNLTFDKKPVILKDGIICSAPNCNITDYASNDLEFSVSGFSNYTSGANAELTIWDETESGMPFYEDEARVGENVSFYANYTNRTLGVAINTSTCNITFTDLSALMTFNATKNVFEYNRTFSSAFENQIINYNITCNHTNFETLNTTNNLQVLTSDANCSYPGANIDWIINGTEIVTCVGENLLLNQSSLLIQDNATFILEDSNLTLIVGTDNNITISRNANFTAKNSRIESKTASKFDLYIYGYGQLYNTVLNNSRLYIKGNKTHYINSSTFYDFVYFMETSKNYIMNSNFSTYSYFKGTSENIIQHSLYGGTVYIESVILNFTQPQSSIVTDIDISFSTPKIYGYVDMPSTVTVSGSTIERFYPIRIVYSSNTSKGVANKQVNITNSTGLVWNGTTDADGWVTANLTFDSTNYGDGNFTLNINPSQNISLLTDTPIEFNISDITPPRWSNNLPPSPAVYSPTQIYQFFIEWTDDVAVDDVILEFAGTNYSYKKGEIEITEAGNTYYKTFLNLAAGNHTYRWYANDTSNNWNQTPIWNYIINKTSSVVNLLLNGTDDNLTVGVGSIVNETGISVAGEAGIELYEQGILVNNGTSPLTNLTQYNTLGTFNVTVKYPATQNYSASEETHWIIVQDTTLPIVLDITPTPGTNYNLSDSVNITANVTDDQAVDTVRANITWPGGSQILVMTAPNLYNATFTNTTVIGRYNVTILANDTSGNINNTETIHFNVNDVTKPTITLNYPDDNFNTTSPAINFNWTAIDNYDDNLTCNLTINGIVNVTIDSQNGIATNYSVSGFADNIYYWNITCWDDSNNLNTSETRLFRIDTTPPAWSDNKTSPVSAAYSPVQNYQFNITWQDTGVGIDTVLFEHNFTGSPQTVSYNGSSGNEYFLNYSNLAAGTYYWQSHANDTLGNPNSTDSFTYTVSKAASTCSLIFDKQSPQNYSTQINASCSCTNQETGAKLYRNSTDVTATENNQLITLPAGTWNYTCNVSSTQNYTSATNTSLFTITKADPSSNLHLALNDTENNLIITYGTQSNATGWSDLTDNQNLVFKLYRNNTEVDSGDPASEVTTLAATSYSYVYNTTGGANYTAGSSPVRILTINKFIPEINLLINGFDSDKTIESGTIANFTITLTPINAFVYLYENTTLLKNDTTPFNFSKQYIQPVTYAIKAFYNASQNYTNSTEIHILTVQDTIPPSVSTIQPTSANEDVLVNYNATITDIVGVSSCNLFVNGVNNGSMTLTGTTANKTITIQQPGQYLFLANCSDAAGNYNDTSITTVTINDITPPIWSDNKTNPTTIRVGDSVQFNVTWNDNVNLSGYIFSTNDTGSWQNSSSTQFTTNISTNTAIIQSTRGTSIGWMFYANDTSNNWNQTPIFNITIANTAPVLTVPPELNNTIPKTNDIIKCSNGTYYDADTDSLNKTYWKWYLNKTEITGETAQTLNLSKPNNGNRGDNITCAQKVSDSTANSTWHNSSNYAIVQNTPPVASSVNVKPNNPLTNETLNCSYTYSDADDDSESVTLFKWYEGGNPTTITTQTVNSVNTSDGEEWRCEVKPYDSYDYGTPINSTNTEVINSSAPSITSIIDDSNTTAPTNIGGNVTFTIDWSDPDQSTGENASIYICNSSNISVLGCTDTEFCSITNTSNDPVNCSYTTQPQDNTTIDYWVRVCDDSNSCSVVSNGYFFDVNHQPTADSISVIPINPTTTNDLTCNYTFTDQDLDSEESTTYKWYKNNTLQPLTAQTIGSGNTTKNQNWTCEVTPIDQHNLAGSAANSSAIPIQNTPPLITSVNITPALPNTTSLLNCTPSGWIDPDNDAENYFYIWYNNSALMPITTQTLNCSSENGCNKNDNITCQITPNDGTANGTARNVSVIIQNTPPVLSSIGTKNKDEDSTLTIPLSAIDADNDTLTYGTNATQGNLNTATGLYTWNIDFNDAGTYSVLFNVTDGTITDQETITITVNDVNRPPTIDSFTPSDTIPTITKGSSQLFSIIASDPDEDSISMQWYVNNSPQAGKTDFFYTYTNTSAGIYIIKVIVDDSELDTSRSWILTVNEPYVPPTEDGGSSGGSSGGGIAPISPACIENWNCSDWNACTAGMQTRTCTDLNSCGTIANKPSETRTCEETVEEELEEEIFLETPSPVMDEKTRRVIEEIESRTAEENITEKYEKASKSIKIKRKVEFDTEENKTKINLTIQPTKFICGLSIYESIPKCLAERIEEIIPENVNYTIINPDPLMMWHFTTANIEQIDLSYEINKLSDTNCTDQITTLAVAEKVSLDCLKSLAPKLFRAVIPLLLIPFIAILFIYFDRFKKKKKEKPASWFKKIEFGIEELLLLALIALNILDFMHLLPDYLNYIKKIASWTILAYLIYKISPTKIFFGHKKINIDLMIVLSYLLLILKNAVAFISITIKESQVLTQFYSTVLENTLIIEYTTFTIGAILLILVALYSTFTIEIKKPSLLHIMHEEGKIQKKIFKSIVRFLTIFFVLIAFFVMVFNLMMEWLAVSVDAPLLMTALFFYLFIFIKHSRKFNPEKLIYKLGAVGERFYEKFIELFKSKKGIFLAISGMLVLHLLVDLAVFMIPYLFKINNPLYFDQLNLLTHKPVLELFLNHLSAAPLLLDKISISIIYLFNAIAMLLLLASPAYIWYHLYKNKGFTKTSSLTLSLFFGSVAVFILAPLFKIASIATKGMIGVDIQTQTILSSIQLQTVAIISISILLITFLISFFRSIKKILTPIAILLSLSFFISYIYFFFIDTINYYTATIISLFYSYHFFIAFYLLLFLTVTLIFYIGGSIALLYEIFNKRKLLK